MSEMSFWWTTEGTTPVGDQVAEYSQAHLATIAEILAACSGFEGIAPGYLDGLAPSNGGANTVNIAAGGAIVDGKPYRSNAVVNVNIPSASGGGNTRIDRIVLRADWSAFTVRIHRIAGTDAASPVAPAITQISGTTYDIQLCRVLVDTAGTVTVTDERKWATLNDNLRKSPSNSVIGRQAVSGAPYPIQASTEDRVLARAAGGDVDFQQVATAMIANGAVTAGKIANGGVDTTARLANDIVDDTKVGNRVPQFYRRQGGSATNWNTPGSTTYTPTMVRMQAGANATAGSGSVAITFPTAFSYSPLVSLTVVSDQGVFLWLSGVSATGFTVNAESPTGVPMATVFHWLAIGPE